MGIFCDYKDCSEMATYGTFKDVDGQRLEEGSFCEEHIKDTWRHFLLINIYKESQKGKNIRWKIINQT